MIGWSESLQQSHSGEFGLGVQLACMAAECIPVRCAMHLCLDTLPPMTSVLLVPLSPQLHLKCVKDQVSLHNTHKTNSD